MNRRLLVTLIIFLVVSSVFVAWLLLPKQASPSTQTIRQDNIEPDVTLKIPELGIAFIPKDRVTPLISKVSTRKLDNVTYKDVFFSTQQLVDRGHQAYGSGKNFCSFSDFSLTSIDVFDNENDAVTALRQNYRPALALTDLTQENGFYRINGKIFWVQGGIFGAPCLTSEEDVKFEGEQWENLHSFLTSIQAI